MHQYLEQIDKDIAAKHLLKHPFYLAWARGELSKDALTDYARQYYHHVAAFPTYLSAVHANCDDQATRKQLLNNLIDEEAGSPNHPALWKKFAAGLGIKDGKLARTEKQPETKRLTGTWVLAASVTNVLSDCSPTPSHPAEIPTPRRSRSS